MDAEGSGDEIFSQEIGQNGSSSLGNDPDDDSFLTISQNLDDSDDLPSFISTPSSKDKDANDVEDSEGQSQGKTGRSSSSTTAFKRADFVWAKHKEIWWPAVVKNVYKARRCATVIWTDVSEEDRKRNLAFKGFKISLSSMRSWSCAERKSMMAEGESRVGPRFESAVGILDNYLVQKAVRGMRMDIFEYLASVHGNMYSLLDFGGENKRCASLAEEDDDDGAVYSPDIKRLKREEKTSLPDGNTAPSKRDDNDVEPEESQDSGVVENNNRLDADDENLLDRDTTSNTTRRVRRNLRKYLGDDDDVDADDKKRAADASRTKKIVEFIVNSDECRQKLRAIYDDEEKSFLKVFYQHQNGRFLKEAKLNNFGPLKRDEDVDRVVAALKTRLREFSGKSTLKSEDLELVMDVYLPEALAFALHSLEGLGYNDALRRVWFGTSNKT